MRFVALEDAIAASHALANAREGGGDGGLDHAESLATIDAAVRGGQAVGVVTTLTRSNARSMPALAALLAAHGVAAWRIELVRAHDEADAAKRLPSLGVTVPHVLLAVERAARHGLRVSLRGLPHCVLGPYARWHDDTPDEAASGPPCDGCPARAGCPGLTPLHRARFGGRELRVRDPAEPATAPARSG